MDHGRIIRNFAAIHKNIAARPLSMNLKARRPGRRADDFTRTNLGRHSERLFQARNCCQCTTFTTCILFTTKCTETGRNIYISAFSIPILIIFISLKNNKKIRSTSFLLVSNVAIRICTKCRPRQAQAAENQWLPVASHNKAHRNPRLAVAARARRGPPPRGGLVRAGARAG